jgi:putative membrane-bound dehydrogenase-like protein
MRTVALFALCLVVMAGNAALIAPPPARTHTVALNGHTFTLPAGFTIEVAARPPLVDRPIVADLDDDGRLFVADSSGSNEKVEVQLKKKPHRILRLVDSKGDGVFDQRTVFADRMMFPEGVLCFDGSVYVAAPPSIWKLTDADGDGVAEQRVEWFQGKTLTGCANDLHGPYLGPDGWVYWCKGAFAPQTYKRPGKKDLVTSAAHIFRARPDGSGIEPVMTGGMDNPVDVVFTPSGERIFTTTFFQHPAGGRRDGLVHAVYGGVYGKDHHVIHGHKRTGPDLMPVLTHMGPAAPAGLTRYESTAFGPAYQDNLFAVQFNMHKVSRHVLVPDGSTYRCSDEDFLVSDNRDFHPTDVIEDADGSLLVVDTGGWYKLCCPTSQLVKPDLLGAIYRVRRTDAPRVADPRGRKIAWAKLTVRELAGLLGDARPAVRRRAIRDLAKKGDDAIGPLTEQIRTGKSVEARRNAVWTTTRIDHPCARAAIREALADRDETVRQVALHSASLWRDREALPALVKVLESRSPHNRRCAAEALGRIGDAKAVPALLKAASRPCDRVLEHSLTYALIEINDRTATLQGLESDNARARRAALVALDQMDDGKLDPATVAKELASSDAAVREAAWWIAGRHPGWGDTLVDHFRQRLAGAKTLSVAQRADLAAQLGRFAGTAAVQGWLADRLADRTATREERRLVLEALAHAPLKAMPPRWNEALAALLSGDDVELAGAAVAALRHLPRNVRPDARVIVQLRRLAENERGAAELRLAALAAVPGSPGKLQPGLFSFVLKHLHRDQDVAARAWAADVLSRAELSGEQLLDLAGAVKTVGPMELDRALDAFTRSADEKVGEKLLAGLRDSPVRSSLQVDRLRARLAKYPAGVRKQAEGLIAALDADQAKRKEHLDSLAAELKKGDVRRGQAVFNSQKTACSTCHAIGYLGGKVGPDLTQIGKIRSERDLLEAILYPSASFVRSYEPVLVTTTRGQSYNGLVRKDSPDEVVLATGATEEVRIRRRDIERIEPSKVSIMPAGLDKVLTKQELADLVAFLRACR